jgi:hypothetical protein
MRYGDGIHGMKYDGKFTYGASEDNAARAHHLKPGLHDGCYVSFSRSLQVATWFATRGGEVSGFVYVIDEDLLAGSGVIAKEFPDPEYPDEIEVSLRAGDNGVLPAQIIVAKLECRRGQDHPQSENVFVCDGAPDSRASPSRG